MQFDECLGLIAIVENAESLTDVPAAIPGLKSEIWGTQASVFLHDDRAPGNIEAKDQNPTKGGEDFDDREVNKQGES